MILVDSSIWVDHLRHSDPELVRLLERFQVLTHPFVIGELALGNLSRRGHILTALDKLPKAAVASDDEVMRFIEAAPPSGLGIGYVDAHLLASTRLTAGAAIWTRDRRLAAVAQTFAMGFQG